MYVFCIRRPAREEPAQSNVLKAPFSTRYQYIVLSNTLEHRLICVRINIYDFNVVVLRGDMEDFFIRQKKIYFCGKGSGATLNESKTFVMWIGAHRDVLRTGGAMFCMSRKLGTG